MADLVVIRPNDVVVIECDGRLSHETHARIMDELHAIVPDVKWMILHGGLKIAAKVEADDELGTIIRDYWRKKYSGLIT